MGAEEDAPLGGIEVVGTVFGAVAGVEFGCDDGTVVLAGRVDAVCEPPFVEIVVWGAF